MIPVNRPSITQEDIASVMRTLSETMVSGETPVVADFEKQLAEYLGVQEVIAVSSGTTALDLIFDVLEVAEADECLVPAATIISTVSNIVRRGGSLKLVDSDINSWCWNHEEMISKINHSTKFIIPVHLYGLAANLSDLDKLSSNYNFQIIEDAAEALGTKHNGSLCGTIGNAGIFSFYPNKIVTGGEGGAIATNDKVLAKSVRYYKNLCFKPEIRFVHENLGWNYRLNGMSAALLQSQLLRIESLISRKREIGARYSEGLREHTWLTLPQDQNDLGKNNYWVYGVVLNEETSHNSLTFRTALRELEVESRSFFCPMHLQPVFRELNLGKYGEFPISELLWERGLYLPSGNAITNDEIDQVIDKLWELVKR